jgi:quercetin dioxygenase-like cupin family protein
VNIDERAAAGGSYGTTSGSDERESRPLMERLMLIDLGAEIERLRGEEDWQERDRNSRMLAKEVDFRVMLTVMRVGARLTEEDGDARVSIQMLDGGARLDVGRDEEKLPPGALAVVDAGQPWALTASGDCAVLLTLAWPREKARPEGTGAA